MSRKDDTSLLSRGVEEIIGEKELKKKIISGKKIRIKHGVDPTTPDLHLGYAVNYQKMREFQERGHEIVFLIGDFTGRFGDPSDQNKTRKMRAKNDVKKLAKNYLDQVGKIIDIKKTEIRYNSEWYDKMSAEELLGIMSRFTVARMLERDMFQERINNKLEIGLHEPIYPILQGYDSVMIKSDATICGSDQKFNELQGRKLQEDFGQDPQAIITTPLLIGLDGKKKMSQSLGNYIGITESANIQYGKIMSIPDELIPHYYELAACVSDPELERIKKQYENPNKRRELKSKLARSIIELYHGIEGAVVAESEFNRVFRDKEYPMNMKEEKIKNPRCEDLPQLLFDLKLVSSKSDARRLIEQKGVKIDKAIIEDPSADICFHDKMVIQVGKFKFVKIRL